MTRIAVKRMREDFDDTIGRVEKDGETIIIRRGDKDVVVMVPADEFKRCKRLWEQAEDLTDLIDALKAEADALERDEKPIPWSEARELIGA